MNNDSDDEYVKIKKSELEEMKSKIAEQEIIIEHAKGYAFGLESKNVKYLQRIKQLKKGVDYFESSTSWKITKPLRVVGKLFKR